MATDCNYCGDATQVFRSDPTAGDGGTIRGSSRILGELPGNGGQNNIVGPGTNHASIFGGSRNSATGSCSAILGGSGNSDNGFAWAGVFGCNVVGVTACAFHSNTFVAQNMCNLTGGGIAPPTGTFYYCVVSPGVCAVYIS